MSNPRNPLAGAPAAALLAALVAAGCAAPQKKPLAVWPPPPEKTRIEYVRAFRTADQLDPGAGRKVLNALLPKNALAYIVSPSGLAMSPDDRRLYVACGGRGRIVVVDLEARTFSVIGPDAAQRPITSVGVAMDADENVYVADRMANAVLVYDRGGRFLRKFGAGLLEAPTTIAVDRRGQVVYVASGAVSNKLDHRIEVFSLAGQHLRTMGKRGEGPGEFNFPTGLTVAPDGSLYVVDTLNFRIQQFDREGRLLSMFGRLGTGGLGAFDKAKGVAFDSFGNVYVVDSMQGVQILSPERKPLMGFGAPPVMSVPGPIVIDSRNRIFIADFSTNYVHEFRLVNTTAEDSYAKPEEAAEAPATSSTPGKTGEQQGQ